MTRKDFELIAAILAEYRGGNNAELIDTLSEHLGTAFSCVNPRFDFDKFIAAAKGD